MQPRSNAKLTSSSVDGKCTEVPQENATTSHSIDPEISRHTLKRSVTQTSKPSAITLQSTDILFTHHVSSWFHIILNLQPSANDITQSYLIQNNSEKYISLNRGHTALDVVNKSLDNLQHWSDSDIKKLIACVCTNMPYEKTTPLHASKKVRSKLYGLTVQKGKQTS